jgi:hypothetical protein
VHLTLGILRKSQAVSYALSFFWLDGFAVPAPAQVTQTVSCFLSHVSQVVFHVSISLFLSVVVFFIFLLSQSSTFLFFAFIGALSLPQFNRHD